MHAVWDAQSESAKSGAKKGQTNDGNGECKSHSAEEVNVIAAQAAEAASAEAFKKKVEFADGNMTTHAFTKMHEKLDSSDDDDR